MRTTPRSRTPYLGLLVATIALRLGLLAIGISFAIELSQLYRAPWIDSIRATRPGALVLGQGFLWSDLVCYSAGVVLAMALDAWLASPMASRGDGVTSTR